MNTRTAYILNTLKQLNGRLLEHDPFNKEHLIEEESDFIEKLNNLFNIPAEGNPDFLFELQEFVARFIRCYPNLVPLMKRELLWFAGGECLHFLGDEELALYELLEDEMYQQSTLGNEYDISKLLEALKQAKQSIH
ncbi:PA2817 family protein [Marinomonas balearica]|uniref:Dehydrogenase n=1 Tax=Marinomonas balearica TaxID=491947 RepID=A0A4R6M6G2_9GAMM|nr:PA2817 family protein [Marinomonas balearica]TDO96874.1 hypothetical protein DFP79_2643 [Marinomonas balearica]